MYTKIWQLGVLAHGDLVLYGVGGGAQRSHSVLAHVDLILCVAGVWVQRSGQLTLLPSFFIFLNKRNSFGNI